MRVAVAGGGVFGVTAALALRRRGHDVALVDPGPLPHPLAESTDISKVVRLDYGADELYTELAERAMDGWRRWNRAWPAPRFHETGVAYLTRDQMGRSGFEHDSLALLERRGHACERLDAAAIARRYPAFRPGAFQGGYYNPQGGWAEATEVVRHLLGEARDAGVAVRGGCAARAIAEADGRAAGLVLADGAVIAADLVVVASGAWAGQLSPALARALRASGQPVFHLRPADPTLYRPEVFPVFCDDIARTGYYSFPINRDGLVKVANHGPGVDVDMTRSERPVAGADEDALREFLGDALPDLAGAEIASRRLCVYGDTADGHFWIDEDPALPGLMVAAGGSGHGFKFAPILGDLIADAAVGPGLPPALAHRFRWRPEVEGSANQEAARFLGPPSR
ncbi:MAG TPA: FAD-dependent oxidoreductase [Kofleriaceae bacterium]|nr:FAD-dependent oxidoreductase [Kofleriaceae bacterium]